MKMPTLQESRDANVAEVVLKPISPNGKYSARNLSRVIKQIVIADTSLDIKENSPAALQTKLRFHAKSFKMY